MKKPPGFYLMADDFLGGTQGMSAEEIGAYLLLLIYQSQNGRVPKCKRRRAQIVRSTLKRSTALWEALEAKFEADESGDFFNARLAKDVEKDRKFRINASEAGKRGGRPTLKGSAKGSAKGSESTPTPTPTPTPASKELGGARTCDEDQRSALPDDDGAHIAPPKVAARAKPYPLDFEAFWNYYPRRVHKGAAAKAYAAAKRKIGADAADVLLEAVAAFGAAWEDGEIRFCPHAATWLNADGWNDDRSQWGRKEESNDDRVQSTLDSYLAKRDGAG